MPTTHWALTFNKGGRALVGISLAKISLQRSRAVIIGHGVKIYDLLVLRGRAGGGFAPKCNKRLRLLSHLVATKSELTALSLGGQIKIIVLKKWWWDTTRGAWQTMKCSHTNLSFSAPKTLITCVKIKADEVPPSKRALLNICGSHLLPL